MTPHRGSFAKVVAGLILAVAPLPCAARGTDISGARELSLGGSGLADARNLPATHINPAAFAFGYSTDVRLPTVVVDWSLDGNLLNSIDRIDDLFAEASLTDIDHRLTQGQATAEDLDRLLELFVYRLPELGVREEDLLAGSRAGLAVRHRWWGFSVGMRAFGGASTIADLSNGVSAILPLAIQALPEPTAGACNEDAFCMDFAARLVVESAGFLSPSQAEQIVYLTNPRELSVDDDAQVVLLNLVRSGSNGASDDLTDNTSGLFLRGLVVREHAFHFGRKVSRRLGLGASFKMLQGEGYGLNMRIDDMVDHRDLFDRLYRAAEPVVSTSFGIDLGLLYRATPRFSIGLVGRDLNGQRWELSTGTVVEVDPRARVGIAWHPKDRLHIAADVDALESNSVLAARRPQRWINLGLEWVVFRGFAIRGGVMRNVTAQYGTVYTAGVGTRIGRFEFDVGAALSEERRRIAGSLVGTEAIEFPRGAAVALTVGFGAPRRPRARE